jgi:hypothetical protein
MKENDVLCVLYGGNVPFIIRPTTDGEAYTLVGECYVHDLMHGEAVDHHDTSLGEAGIQTKEIWIELR